MIYRIPGGDLLAPARYEGANVIGDGLELVLKGTQEHRAWLAFETPRALPPKLQAGVIELYRRSGRAPPAELA